LSSILLTIKFLIFVLSFLNYISGVGLSYKILKYLNTFLKRFLKKLITVLGLMFICFISSVAESAS